MTENTTPQAARTRSEGQPVAELEVLRTALADAFMFGRDLAKAQISPARGAVRVRQQVADLVESASELFAEGSVFRKAAIAALKAAIDSGHDDYGESPDLGPGQQGIEAVVDSLLESFFVGASLEGLADLSEGDLLEVPELDVSVVHSAIDDRGVHRVRSDFMRDDEGALYQIIVVRAGEDVTVYRRYSGDTEATPVLGGVTTQEANFLSLAFAEIRAERGETL